MLSSITPLGERGRASRWPVTAAAHLLGSAPVLAMRGVTTPDRLVAVHRRLESMAPTGRSVAACTSGALVLAAAAQLALTAGTA